MSKRISELNPVQLPLAGNESLEIVQSGKSLRVRVADLVQRAANGESAFQIFQRLNPDSPLTESQWLETLKGANGKSAYQLAIESSGFDGTVSEWLESLKGEQGPQGEQGIQGPKGEKGDPGTGGGGGGGIPSLVIQVDGWSSDEFTLPDGVTVEKVYSDSSLQINHGMGKYPTGWSALNRESDPMTMLTPTSVRNLQVVDENTVIMTSMSGFEQSLITILFQ